MFLEIKLFRIILVFRPHDFQISMFLFCIFMACTSMRHLFHIIQSYTQICTDFHPTNVYSWMIHAGGSILQIDSNPNTQKKHIYRIYPFGYAMKNAQTVGENPSELRLESYSCSTCGFEARGIATAGSGDRKIN